MYAVRSALRLNLAHNAFGDMGTQMLGRAVKFNTSLRHLDVSYNKYVIAMLHVPNAEHARDISSVLSMHDKSHT